MGLISRIYVKSFVCRYDREVGIPYYKYTDFPGLKEEQGSFINTQGVEIHYFYYYYDGYRQDKVLLFLNGIGCGHISYFAEIEYFAKRGYKVLTLDYRGCGDSKGDNLMSLNSPTRDTVDLLNHLKLDVPVVLVGHSLGGYTALNVMAIRKDITKAVVISGFLSVPMLGSTIVRSQFINNRIGKYEHKVEPDYCDIDNLAYLKDTRDDLLFIHSEDDNTVPYDISMKIVEQIDNPHLRIMKVNDKKHLPQYSQEAVNYMNEVFGEYYKEIKEKTIKTDEQKINYFKDVSIQRLTEQDDEVMGEIIKFLE